MATAEGGKKAVDPDLKSGGLARYAGDMIRRPAFFRLFVLVVLAVPWTGRPASVDFAHEIAPVIRQYCADCHLGEKKKGGLSLNTRALWLEGSENGAVLELGKGAKSLLVELLHSADPDVRMPPKGDRVPPEKIALLQRWIDDGAPWEPGFTFGKEGWEPPLAPRAVTLPPVVEGRQNAVDRLLDAWRSEHRVPLPAVVDDAAFFRRVSLDLLGLLPDPAELDAFVAEAGTDKRTRLIDRLLARDESYADHWLSFWNDLLRNDYAGTGYIDGGRKQITGWLYAALLTNRPYDQFVRELMAPGPEAEGFINGIQWRGSVNASQVREIQFSQNISQVFLGINMKCASCHDSFIDRWKLDEAYGLAAIFASSPLEIHRCDKGTGKMAEAAWIFPELGKVDPAAPREKRLAQLAALMTDPGNGRFTRTLVNRLWHRLMGRGIVHPVDAMHTRPWNEPLLDWLASDFAEHAYDVKHTLKLIASSVAYQSEWARDEDPNAGSDGYVFRGPVARRLTAEQFMDAIWSLTGTAPQKSDAVVAKPAPAGVVVESPVARWIWSYPEGSSPVPKPGETITLRRSLTLNEAPLRASAVVTCDNEYSLFVNGGKVGGDADWGSVETLPITLRKGPNEILLVAKNAGNSPNPAAAWCQLVVHTASGILTVGTDADWQWSALLPDARGKFAKVPDDWKPAAEVARQDFLPTHLDQAFRDGLANAVAPPRPVRASLVKSNLLTRALGRPNREQVVTVRPEELTTLEAIDLSNGDYLSGLIAQGAAKLVAEYSGKPAELGALVYRRLLSRQPLAGESEAIAALLGKTPDARAVEDLLWAVIMLPEFHYGR